MLGHSRHVTTSRKAETHLTCWRDGKLEAEEEDENDDDDELKRGSQSRHTAVHMTFTQ